MNDKRQLGPGDRVRYLGKIGEVLETLAHVDGRNWVRIEIVSDGRDIMVPQTDVSFEPVQELVRSVRIPLINRTVSVPTQGVEGLITDAYSIEGETWVRVDVNEMVFSHVPLSEVRFLLDSEPDLFEIIRELEIERDRLRRDLRNALNRDDLRQDFRNILSETETRTDPELIRVLEKIGEELRFIRENVEFMGSGVHMNNRFDPDQTRTKPPGMSVFDVLGNLDPETVGRLWSDWYQFDGPEHSGEDLSPEFEEVRDAVMNWVRLNPDERTEFLSNCSPLSTKHFVDEFTYREGEGS